MANILYTFYYSTPEKRPLWDEMAALNLQSFTENLDGEWEYRRDIMDETLPQKDIFYEFFKRMYAMWQEGHNVLYTNVDILCVAPVEVFGDYPHLTMFWPTDPPSTPEFPIQFNGGLMYIPKTVTQDIWDYGFREYERELAQVEVPWATDQTVFNRMLYKQGVDPETFKDNEMHYLVRTPHLNSIPKKGAAILHYFGTRGMEGALDAMKSDWRDANG